MNFDKLQDKMKEFDARKEAVKPVQKLSAQYATMYAMGYNEDLVFKDVLFKLQHDKTLGHFDRIVIVLLAFHGVRISEALALHSNDVTKFGEVLIRGIKGSSNRIVRPIVEIDSFIFLGKNCVTIADYRSRFYYYRLFRKWGMYSKFGDNENVSVTHYFRHKYVLRQLDNGVSLEDIQKDIGHVNKSNTEIYAKREKKFD